MLLNEADEAVIRHGYSGFQKSNGWLQRFIVGHQIKMSALHGESAEVAEDVVSLWKDKLSQLCEGYSDSDIYNMDMIAIFFRLLPSKSYITSNENNSGVKVLKDRYTVVCCANLNGDQERLTIIGKVQKSP